MILPITVSALETLKHQQEVELYYNKKVINKHEITEIQKSKLKAKVLHNNNKDPNLENTASLVARGIVLNILLQMVQK